MSKRNRIIQLYQLVTDFTAKCSSDHVTAFGAMSAFFLLLSLFPFMIFFLTLTKYLPFSKDDILNILTQLITFEQVSFITGIVNEVYGKATTTVFTISILTALWSASKGVYSIVMGLNSVYDIDENRNYIMVRLFSLLCTVLFAIMIIIMLVIWVFGNTLYNYITVRVPIFESIAGTFIHKRGIVSIIGFTLFFMIIYKYVPNRKTSFKKQFPGALVATIGWMAVSTGCSIYVDHFHSFSYVYGSMAGIMIILLWLYLCMSIVYYGAEINYFLENKHNYHLLVRILRPNLKNQQRKREQELLKEEAENRLWFLQKKQEKKRRQKK